MPRHADRPFTDKFIAGLKPNGAPQEYSDASCKGLGLRVSRVGQKAWRLSYSFGSQRKRPSIGDYPTMSLADARAKRDEVFRGLTKGVDLLAGTAPSERADYAFNKIAEDFIRLHVEAKSKDPGDARNIVRNEYIAAWGSRDIRTITRRDVHALLDKVAKRAPIQANRVKARGSKLFRWAVQRGYREDSPFFVIEMPAKERERARVLSDAELKAIWQGLESVGYPYAPIVRLLTLLGQRRSEVASMQWAHLDLDTATWTMPTTKNDEAFVLPLPAVAIRIIKACPCVNDSAFVFPSRVDDATCVSGFSKWKAELDATCKVTGWRLHDLRRTMASKMPPLGVDADTIDRIQNHKLTGGNVPDVRETYNRYAYLPQMLDALDKWAAHVRALAA